ncbi:MAG: alpha/beta hydrolase family protein [Acidimicrobiales bacterium]
MAVLICLLVGAVGVVVTRGSVSHRSVVRTRRTTPAVATTVAPPGSTSTLATTQPPYPVVRSAITLTDPTRDTPPRGLVPGHVGRTLRTELLRPVGPVGPLPLVVFAHGWNSDPGKYGVLLDAWAAAGYLVAAPVFPDSADTLPGPPVSNYPEQARDLSFVISALLGGRVGPVDPSRIAVAGHSDGGTDVNLMALNPSYADPRVRAYLSLSGEIPAGVPGPWNAPTKGALLVAVGTADEYGLFAKSTQVFLTAEVGAKIMLTVSGGRHLDTYIAATPEAIAMRAETVRFLNAALRPGGISSAELAAALSPTGSPAIVLSGG